MELNEQIRVARESAGMTQEQLADKLEVSKQAVVWWETGVHSPRLAKLRLIEELLHTRFNATGSPDASPEMAGVAAEDVSLAIAIRRLPKAQRDAIVTLVQLGANQAGRIDSFVEKEDKNNVDGQKIDPGNGSRH